MAESDKELLWEEKSKKTLLKTPIAVISQTTSIASDGQEGQYIIIDSRDWVIVIPEKDEKFMMVKQYRHGEKALSIEFPGGVIDDGETPSQAASRELLEETGCYAGKMTYLGKMNPNPAFMANHVHIFLAENLTETGKQNLDDDEYLNYLKMDKQEVFDKTGTAEMPHALMAAALAMYTQHKK